MRVFTSVCYRRDETEGVASVLAYLFMLKRTYEKCSCIFRICARCCAVAMMRKGRGFGMGMSDVSIFGNKNPGACACQTHDVMVMMLMPRPRL